MKLRPGPGIDAISLNSVPLLAKAATILLECLITGADVFEVGSGGSTAWLATRVNRLTSVEDDPRWHSAVLGVLEFDLGGHFCLILRDTIELPNAIEGTGEWDVVIVDCWTQNERRQSIITGAPHVRSGGWLVADDYNFPLVKKSVEELRSAGWDVAIVEGIKLHTIRYEPVTTSTAFCRKA